VSLECAVFGTSTRAQQPGDVKTVHVQGSVYMIVGGGANLAVQVGDDGVFVVDARATAFTDSILAAIRELSKRDIRWMVNTTLDTDHIGGNEKISNAGRTVNGNPAATIAHEKLPLDDQVAHAGSGERAAAQYVLQRVEGFLLQRRCGLRLSRAGPYRRRHDYVLPPLGRGGGRGDVLDEGVSGDRHR
jgi:glyoxylase-like metal-dependent hydrolase (beta-lactamase superfamily II)